MPTHRDPTETADERMTAAATAVLQHRLDGEPHRSALRRVGASHAMSEGEVRRAWVAKRREALAELTVGRVTDACPWTAEEFRRLTRIFARAPRDATADGAGRDAGAS